MFHLVLTLLVISSIQALDVMDSDYELVPRPAMLGRRPFFRGQYGPAQYRSGRTGQYGTGQSRLGQYGFGPARLEYIPDVVEYPGAPGSASHTGDSSNAGVPGFATYGAEPRSGAGLGGLGLGCAPGAGMGDS